MTPIDPIATWESVKTGGLLLAPSRLADVFPQSLEPLSAKTVERLRRAIAGLDGAGPPPWLLDVVLEEVLGLGRPLEPDTGQWLKGVALGSEWTHRALSGEAVKPQRVWQGAHGAMLPVFTDRERRLGIGRGRRMPARVAEWLRASQRPLALLTNGWQWRLIHASLDAEAFAEWDVGLWFEEGEPGPQVAALRALLARGRLTPPAQNASAPLLAAIAASRKGQGELSAELGERVRRAVELLIQRVFTEEGGKRKEEREESRSSFLLPPGSIYRAATRMVMRMVVVLFAEARDDLLPRDNPVYHLSYGLQGLREALQQAGAGTRDGLARLAHRHSAWARVLALSRLIYHGSPHKDLPLIRYGGGLFEPGDAGSDDPLRRALAVLEDPARGPNDADVYRILDLLCVTEMRLRQGTAYRWVNVPVDFSDLSSEYIGILYEGLLDYELRRADPGDPIVFLALGDQPALPLSRLEAMSDKTLADLVAKLKAKVKAKPPGDGESADDEEGGEEGDGEADSEREADGDTDPDSDPEMREGLEQAPPGESSADQADDARQAADERAQMWARRAVEAGRLVCKPKSKKKAALDQHAGAVAAAARLLIARTILPGEWFLVRWGGTRKGAGTFYTRPALAVPTVQRTLRPLCYEERGARNEERGRTDDWERRARVSGSDGVEEGYGARDGDLSHHGEAAAPGTIRADATDAEGGGIGAVEHRRGAQSTVHGRLSASSADGPRIGGGAGDAASAGRAADLLAPHRPDAGIDADGRDLPHAIDSDRQDALSDPLVPHSSFLVPRRPEEILALKVCDPAMGSASFLVASLRFLTDALFRSLHHHGRIAAQGEQTLVTLAEGRPSEGTLSEETLPCRPNDEDFEPRLRAVLKRYVVERCLYGVDLDPLAVELGRLALWIETLDRDLPFEFLDHKLKVGNALVGCWFDRFRDYPVLAWNREGGDKTHSNGVHFPKEGWTKAIKDLRDGAVKRELIELISRQLTFDDHVAGRTPEALHDAAAGALEAMHALPVAAADKRADAYREHLGSGSPLQDLRTAFDTWCALWFWPADQLDLAPTPRHFAAHSKEQRAVVKRLWNDLRFFHWELEFPDVFSTGTSPDPQVPSTHYAGFDAIVGNPPWEIQKPNSKEFFSNLDPLYRTYGKQDALCCQQTLFEASSADERAWLEYTARFKALSNWNRSAASPFGDGADDGADFSFGRDSETVHADWRALRGGHHGYADPRHPFRHQGSADINTYKMFLEQAYALLRDGGRFGVLMPSGIYTDKGSHDLRELLIDHCAWDQLYAFQNERFVFPAIHHSFKIVMLACRKGGSTDAVNTRFRLGPGDSPELGEIENDMLDMARHLRLPASRIARFSPRTRAILEIRQKRDLEVLEKIYANSVLLGDDSENGWGIKYATEFHMTNDSKLFPPRPWWEERGYVPDEYGRWIKFKGRPNPKHTTPAIGWIRLRDGAGAVSESDIEDIALPLMQGVMINQFDPTSKGWVSGTGAKAKWEAIEWSSKVYRPQFLMGCSQYESSSKRLRGFKVGFRDIARTTDARTMISALVPNLPCGNKVPVLQSGPSMQHNAALQAILNSWVFDWSDRTRQGAASINYFVIEEAPLLSLAELPASVGALAMRLGAAALMFAPWWVGSRCGQPPTRWALTRYERLRVRCILEAVVAELFGLSQSELGAILEDCDQPRDLVGNKSFAASLDPKGFWRVEKDRHPELRTAVLTVVATRDLRETTRLLNGDRDRAIAAFCGTLDPALVPRASFLDPSSGWQLPETLRLADYGLGHDERAKQPQPVRARLGERFFPWQLEQSPEESWKECEIHARNILGEAGFAKLQAELAAGAGPERQTREPIAADSPPPTYARGAQRRLFPGQQTLFGAEMEDPPAAKRRKHR
jgi:hypothetical protein